MLRHVLFDMQMFDGEDDRANSQKRVLCLLEALTWCNQLYLQNHPDTPLIYQSGIKYIVPAQFEKADVPEIAIIRTFLEKKGAPQIVFDALDKLYNIVGGGEIFREIPRIIENGGGDCDNVASWRCAELRNIGINASPYITWRKRLDGGTTYHVIVLWPDGSSEDPSLLLGMGGPERDADRDEEFRKLNERLTNFVAALRVKGMDTARTLLEHGASDQITQTVLGTAINSPQNYNQLQYTIPFQTDDAYADWTPTRPQAYWFNTVYPNLPLPPPGGGPVFNTRMRDPDDVFDRFDGALAPGPGRLRRRLGRREIL